MLKQKSSYLSDGSDSVSNDDNSRVMRQDGRDEEIVDKFLNQMDIDMTSEEGDDSKAASKDGFGFIAEEVTRKSYSKLPFVDAATSTKEDFFITVSKNKNGKNDESDAMCNMSAQSASTYQDSEKIKSLKERKVLHYRPSLELNEG